MHIRILDKYIFREVFKAFIFGICAFSAVFIGSGTLFKIAKYITDYGASLSAVVKVFVFGLPSVIMWTFPMSMLLATLLTFGRLSSSSEITAMKSWHKIRDLREHGRPDQPLFSGQVLQVFEIGHPRIAENLNPAIGKHFRNLGIRSEHFCDGSDFNPMGSAEFPHDTHIFPQMRQIHSQKRIHRYPSLSPG